MVVLSFSITGKCREEPPLKKTVLPFLTNVTISLECNTNCQVQGNESYGKLTSLHKVMTVFPYNEANKISLYQDIKKKQLRTVRLFPPGYI